MKNFNQFFLEKQVLGLIEFFDVDGIGKIPSKLDSGNGAFNVIHGEDIQVQGNKVLFKTVNNQHLMKDKVDDIMRYCEICGMTWEYMKKYSGTYKADQRISKYDHIPTIGKAREECPECKKRLKICDLCLSLIHI